GPHRRVERPEAGHRHRPADGARLRDERRGGTGVPGRAGEPIPSVRRAAGVADVFGTDRPPGGCGDPPAHPGGAGAGTERAAGEPRAGRGARRPVAGARGRGGARPGAPPRTQGDSGSPRRIRPGGGRGGGLGRVARLRRSLTALRPERWRLPWLAVRTGPGAGVDSRGHLVRLRGSMTGRVTDKRRYNPDGTPRVPDTEPEAEATSPASDAPGADAAAAELTDEVTQLRAELDAARRRVDELARGLQDVMRDRDDFKQRIQRERERMIDVEKGQVAQSLIEAIDELDLTLAHDDGSPFAQGIRLIRDKLLQKLAANG